jgi:threonine dehydrogenase-like Zn-dependent dehydrogenase
MRRWRRRRRRRGVCGTDWGRWLGGAMRRRVGTGERRSRRKLAARVDMCGGAGEEGGSDTKWYSRGRFSFIDPNLTSKSQPNLADKSIRPPKRLWT